MILPNYWYLSITISIVPILIRNTKSDDKVTNEVSFMTDEVTWKKI